YQDVPYDIPESWKWVRLNNILDVRDGTHNTPKYVNEGVPLLTSKNLVNGKIVKEPSKLISIEDSLEINKRSKVDKNDILLAMIGTVGNPVLVPELDYEFSVKNVAILKHITELNMKFTYYFIQYHSIELKKISSGAVQNFVSLKTLRQILFPLPPLAEQRRIVSKISKIFSVIETLV
ncbi:TPA: restriction endonuclease subunit S, partial [Streptococcus suis]|nr:restriction endonuclease subunit S [Streptococcus suis]HEL1634938.1 restriction endonuclease subunit S [Streptococcus suis]HEM2759705.1 restriction endonuclease subunit S [Streptococcus suis]HEM3515100.1 restriction endonuclease subunit S [Streptococcus suis]HEM4386864.1 restriction endonuclease subunit S [Streptococcus suis]